MNDDDAHNAVRGLLIGTAASLTLWAVIVTVVLYAAA